MESEEDSAQGAGLSLSNAPRDPNEVSAGCNPGDPSREPRAVPKSVARLDSRYPKSVARLDSRGLKPAVSKQRSVPEIERQQGRQPRVGGRNRHSYRAPPALVDAGGNKRFLVGRMLAHRYVKQKLQILVQWRGYPKSFDSWEPVDALRVDVPGLVSAYEQEHQLHLLC